MTYEVADKSINITTQLETYVYRIVPQLISRQSLMPAVASGGQRWPASSHEVARQRTCRGKLTCLNPFVAMRL